MKVLIDGHNAMSALDIRGRTHEERRHALLSRVAGMARDAVVYFDASKAPEGLFEREALFGVLAIYCRDRSADEYILDAVRDDPQPGRLLVVSNDREVTGKAKQNGAQAKRIEEFFEPVRKERRPPPSSPPPPSLRGFRNDYKPSDFGLPDEVDLEDPDID
ncbi:MAG: NYN domain-containing protein [Planctomycetota bacterium]